MATQITLGGLALDVQFKDIKHLHLSVHPPHGKVTIVAPNSTDIEVVRAFAMQKIGWIRRQRLKLSAADREAPLEYIEHESHYVWGQRYLLRIESSKDCRKVVLSPKHLTLHVDATCHPNTKAAVLASWYRQLVRTEVSKLVKRWSEVLGVKVPSVRVRRMKTKWGSCNHRAGSILINTDLAKKPLECLDYVVLHEMVHLVEPTHNSSFVEIMDRTMPTWRARRDLLNSLPAPFIEI